MMLQLKKQKTFTHSTKFIHKNGYPEIDASAIEQIDFVIIE